MGHREYQTEPSWQMTHAGWLEIADVERFREYDRQGADRAMDDAELDHLTEAIRQHGILHPLGLEWSTADGHAYLGEGHHRLIAARRLGMQRVPVMVHRVARPLAGRAGASYVGAYTGPERDVWDEPRPPEIFSPEDIGMRVGPPELGGLSVGALEAAVDEPAEGLGL
jgi:hypothetical protein